MANRYIAIIPARAGSKGLPQKNIRPLNGKPLIAWSIICAKSVKAVDEVFVSTESDEVASIARQYGSKIIDRPKEFATDSASTIDVLLHAIEDIGASNEDTIILLQPTSPLRSGDDVDIAIKLFKEDPNSPLISVLKAEHNLYWSLMVKEGRLVPLMGEAAFRSRRQDLPSVYTPNGAIYIATVATVKTAKTFFTDGARPYIMPPERSIDIDTAIDFSLAELLMTEKGLH